MLQRRALNRLSDSALLRALQSLVRSDCKLEAELLAHIGEVDARGLFLWRGSPSMYKYLVDELHLSEGVAYRRLTAARAARTYPLILERIASGEIHLSGLEQLLSHLTKENHQELLDRARHRTKAEIKELVADLAPRPDVTSSIRKLPPRPQDQHPEVEPVPQGEPTTSPLALNSPVREIPNRDLPAVETKRTPPPEPLGLGRYEVRFTADRALMGKLQELQALLRHQIPDGDLAKILDRATDLLLEEVKRQKFGKVQRPRGEKSGSTNGKGVHASRHIPAEIRRAVAERDGERCTYVSPEGRRCGSREFLEYEHLKPWASHHRHRADEITLRCRAHNQHAAMLEFGKDYIERCKRERRGRTVAGDSGHGGRATQRWEPSPARAAKQATQDD